MWLFVLVAGCGRIAFEPLDTGDGGNGTGSNGSGSNGSGSNGSSIDASVCPAVPQCPDQTLPVNNTFSTMSSQAITTNHGLSSKQCGSGNGSPEFVWMLVPQVAATYTVTTTPTAIAMYFQDVCCGGVEIMCGAGTMSLSRGVDQRFVVVIEGLAGQSYNLTVTGN